MRIENSETFLAGFHASLERDVEKTSIRTWKNNAPSAQDQPQSQQTSNPRVSLADILDLSPNARRSQPSEKTAGGGTKAASWEYFKALLLKALLEKMTGKKIKLMLPDDVRIDGANAPSAAPGPEAQPSQPSPRQGWGVQIDHYESHYEYETAAFVAEGTVTTTDGRTIDFGAQFQLSREWLQEERSSIRLGDAAQISDPLVINLGGPLAELTDAKYAFDINSDGNPEQISFASPGSGFLALDRDGNGTINSGAELFGPSTGSGFAELAAFDTDNNNWIDEGDSIFSRLRIWSKDAQGVDSLASLQDVGIGAIYLGRVDTPFDAKNENNQLQGHLNSSGIYLNESGSAGIIQQLDLVI